MPVQTLNPPPAATTNGDPTTLGDVTSQATSLAHDLITLAELQTRLLVLDVREAGKRSAASVVILAAMAALILSAGPVVLTGVSELIVANTTWSPGGAKLLVGLIAAVIGAAAGFAAFVRLRRVTDVLNRSQQELNQNLEFVKSLVSGTSESRRSRFSSMN